ncbi:hypothetical protein [Acinetobacter baumannii]|uniref:hypothetical protein n=1 Tax=Acinetobacter baumannii TaxID=470 RepID=UPI0002BB7AA8|nr:hypothetical protein [Acinetobacter baumannii]ANC35185.1 hypothetical protein Aba3207_00530 [Acinetobacter baumannii]AXX40404.1 hypothetical protein Aba9201_04920 [Acinetobacter baumannii]QFY69167.1 hypothetical protein Aba7835_11060 [Acinetobacter baumannii]HAV7106390.1 hypothetical protein [Acinetobacter baumannii]
MSKKNIENERAAFDAWHFKDWNDNCGNELDEVEARHLYNRVYSSPANSRERERSFIAWQAATAQANKKLEGCIVVPTSKEIVITIENMVQQQCDASGVQEPLHRLDGWRILEEIAEKVEEIK